MWLGVTHHPPDISVRREEIVIFMDGGAQGKVVFPSDVDGRVST